MPSRRTPWKATPRDTRCDPVIEWYLNTHGLDSGAECRDTFPDHDAADDIRLSLRRAGNHYGVSVAAWVTNQNGESCWQDCQDPDSPHVTHFKVHSKEHGRAHVAREAGFDPANLRYSPYLRGQDRHEQRRGR